MTYNIRKNTEIEEENKQKMLNLVELKREEETTIAQLLSRLRLSVNEVYTLNEFAEKQYGKENINLLIANSAHLLMGDNGIYNCAFETKSKKYKIIRLTNYTLKLNRKIIKKNFNNAGASIYCYEVEVQIEDKIITMVLSANELKTLNRFEERLSEHAHFNSAMDDKLHKKLIVDILSFNSIVETIIEVETAGYNIINGNQFFACVDNCISYASSSVENLYNIRLSKTSILQPNFIKYEDIINDNEIRKNVVEPTKRNIVSFLLESLFDVLTKAYSTKIEAFIVISMGFINLFLKQISNDFVGTPLITLYGEAGSGKSNLLTLIANAFGFDKSFLHGGMDTFAGIIEDLENHINIPLLIDEIELGGIDSTKSLIKSVYGQTGRKKFGTKNNINTTIFYNSNYSFVYGAEFKSRCIELNFKRVNFNCYEAEKFNKFSKYLSFISQYIIENIQYDDIKTMIKSEEDSELLKQLDDNRIKRNFAIAISGLKLLIKLINDTEKFNFEQFEDRLNQYIKNINLQKNDDIERFITILRELLNETNGKLSDGLDYKISENGVHLHTGKYGKTFEIHFYKIFRIFYKDIAPLRIKEYIKLLKDNGAKMENAYYQKHACSIYGILLPFEDFDELRYLQQRTEYTNRYNYSSSLNLYNNPF